MPNRLQPRFGCREENETQEQNKRRHEIKMAMVCGAETPFKALLHPRMVIMENSKGDLKKK